MTNENKSEQHSFGHGHEVTFIPRKDNPTEEGQKETTLSEKLKHDLDRLALKLKTLYGKKP